MSLHLRILLAFCLLTVACVGEAVRGTTGTGEGGEEGSGEAEGGTETGTTDAGAVDTSEVAQRLEAAASVLVPDIRASGVSKLSIERDLLGLEAVSALTYGTSTQWSTYLQPGNSYVITDIFGDATEEPRVVTKIRVLVDHFASDVEQVVSHDPEVTCEGATPLEGGDSIKIPFYGSLSNGTAEDRHFDCLVGGETEKEIYGIDATEVFRFVRMSDETEPNTSQVAERGDQVRIRAVVHAIYGETSVEGQESVFLDLKFANSTVYRGVDQKFGTADDVLFKSRSRIVGHVILDSAGKPTEARGEFAVTKYDRGTSSTGNPFSITTKTLGRGSFGSGDYAIFKIESNAGTLKNIPGSFCIQFQESGKAPLYSAPFNCGSLEPDYAWGSTVFPFVIEPALSALFEKLSFFAGDETDMIADDGSNFTIPNY